MRADTPAATASTTPTTPVVSGYVKTTFAPEVYLVSGTSATYVTGAQFAAAGYPTVAEVPSVPGTALYKLPVADTVIAVLPGGAPYPITYAQWVAMGAPGPAVVDTVPGLRLVKVPEYPSIWLVGPDQLGRYVTGPTWWMLGRPGYDTVGVIPGSSIVKIPEYDALWAVAPDNTARHINGADWASVGGASSRLVAAIPGSAIQKTTEADTIWAVAPNGDWRALSAADWWSLGAPAPQLYAWSSSRHGVTSSDVWASYRTGCPVGPDQLTRLDVWWWGFDGALHQGSVILATSATAAVEATFHNAFNARFPFRDVSPVDKYGGDDVTSMAADNTSAFNCRTVTGNPRAISQHSYGNAIDYNTVENPYVTSAQVYPAGSDTYLNRGWARRGMIYAGDAIAGTMAAYGWPWGARWSDPDYQHFSANGG